MVKIPITLPALLGHCVDGAASVTVEAATVRGALDALFLAHPKLQVHLYEQNGKQRQHVLIMHNGQSIHWLPSLDHPLSPGDTMGVLQLVTGG